MSNSDVTNPGSVNVVTQGDGLLSVDQPVTVSPSSSAGSATPAIAGGSMGAVNNRTVTNPGTVNVANEAFGTGLPKNVNVH
jgi:hypothetical protein